MNSTNVSGKPPLPIRQKPKSPTQTLSQPKQPLRTSQQETISDGTILGLKNIIYANEPDLTYLCPTCQRFIRLLSFKDHKAYHQALTTLGYGSGELPTSIQALLEKRIHCIKKLKTDFAAKLVPLDINQLKAIDGAYERLKQDIEDTYESCRKIEENIDYEVNGYDIECSLDCVSAVSYCSNQNSRWKSSMEDTKVYQDYFGNDKNKAFLAIYDGYNGKYAAAIAANELHYLLLNEMRKFDLSIACQCTYNMFENNDVSSYDLIRPPTSTTVSQKLFHKQSKNSVLQVIYSCEDEKVHDLHLSSHHPIRYHESEETGNESSARSPTYESSTAESAYKEHMKSAFHRAYKLTDKILEFGGEEKSKVRWSGCSALTIVMESVASKDLTDSPDLAPSNQLSEKLQEDKEIEDRKFDPPEVVGQLHIANAGNCHAVLIRDNKPYLLTKDHTLVNDKEKRRTEAIRTSFGRSFSEHSLLNARAATRGLGNHGDPYLKQQVTWEPYSHTVAIDQYCQMLVLASAGIWQVFSPQEAAEMLLQILPQNRMPSPGYISPSVELLNAADNLKLNADENNDNTICQNEDDLNSNSNQRKVKNTSSPVRAVVNLATASEEHGGATDSKVDIDVTESQVLDKNDSQSELGADEDLIEDSPLPDDVRSLDSGNEADIDTDWASTLAPHDFSRQSIASRTNIAHKQLSKTLAERLVQCALLAGSKDNITAIVVLLPGIKL